MHSTKRRRCGKEQESKRANIYRQGQSGAPNESLWSAKPCLNLKISSFANITSN